MGETIAMAFLGTLLGAVLAFPLELSRFEEHDARRGPLQFGTRRFADLLRSFDYLIWALIFVRAIGLGPLAGIMAIAIVETGTFIKLYSEAIENLDRKQIDGITAAGGGGLAAHPLRRAAAGAADDALEHALHVRAQRALGLDPRHRRRRRHRLPARRPPARLRASGSLPHHHPHHRRGLRDRLPVESSCASG